MAPNLRDQLPILKSLVKWFFREGVVIDSLIFKLHHQGSSFVILIGFVFTFVENYLDHKSILCYTNKEFSRYAHGFCWMHGTAYVRSHLQGQATGCYVDQSKLKTHEDALITSYYLWLPYLLSLLYALAKLPHSLWKRYFENNLISSIIGGVAGGDQVKDDSTNNEDDKQKNDDTTGDAGTEEDNGNNGGGGNNKGSGGKNNQKGQNQNQNQQNQGKKNKGNQQNNKNNQQQKTTPKVMVNSFEEFRHNYASYQRNFLFLESLNIFTLLASIQITHWILNYKFWNYGTQVIDYLTVYGQHYNKGTKIHDPMCELFPTEVSCNMYVGSPTGSMDRSNFLCILQNNLFNQKYFFLLWVWWMVIFFISVLGFFYRMARVLCPPFSRYMLSRRYHGFDRMEITVLSASECFVLELVIDNLNHNPQTIKQVIEELMKRRKESKKSDNVADIEDGFKNGRRPAGYYQENIQFKNETLPSYEKVPGNYGMPKK